MDEWGYLYVTVLDSAGDYIHQVMVNGEITVYPDDRRPVLQDYLEGFRRDGWQRVDTEGTRTFIFRRPREAKHA